LEQVSIPQAAGREASALGGNYRWRHLTFILVSLYEAGYGVQVVGSPAVFRELICLRKSAPIPFVIGGKEREVGISITDQPSTLDAGRSTLLVLGYDFFSGLTTKSTKERKTGKIIDSKIIETTEDMEVAAGLRLAGQAGAEFSNPFTSELARASENTSPTRSARVPALAYRAGELGSNGGNQPGDSEGFLDGQSQAGLQMDNQKDPTIRTANDPSASWEYSSSVLIREIRGQNASSLATRQSAAGACKGLRNCIAHSLREWPCLAAELPRTECWCRIDSIS
jgi:hypothetical protein